MKLDGRSWRALGALLCLVGTVACTGTGDRAADAAPRAQALMDAWSEVVIDRPTPPGEAPARTELRFDGAGLAGVTWRAESGIEDLRIEDGMLVGVSTSAAPAIRFDLPRAAGEGDKLFSVAFRLRASAGSRAGVHPLLVPGPPMPVVLGRIDEWPVSSAIVPSGDTATEGDAAEPTTYTVQLDKRFLLEMPLAQTDIETVLLRPTNQAGATFAIESVRLVFHKEHLATIESGPGWHGVGEVFRETLVARAPEGLRFDVTLPERPWLGLAVAAIEEPAPTFDVTVARAGEDPTTVTSIEVDAAETWTPARVDLTPWAGEQVALTLVARAPHDGTIALWGAPTIRNSLPEADGTTQAPGDPPQTVVLFLADTLRADHLDAWGYGRETAPTLTRLASEGTRFAHAVSQATWTKASVSSILTSLYPSTTGVHNLNDRIAAGETTLAEAFRAAGYATFATSSVPFSGQLTNLHQGVEVLHESGALPSSDGSFFSKSAEAWVDRYLAWLALHHDVPTFAFVHVMDPHSPFQPRAPFDTLWTDDGDAARFAEQAEQVRPHIASPLLRRFMAPTREELRRAGVDEASFVAHEKAWYDGSIRGLDTALGRMLGQLDDLALGDRTLLAFVSDHGEEFLEHGRHWHGQTVYGEVSNVPLVLWGRGVPAGVVIEDTVETIDLMPTLLALAGLPATERGQGESLVPFLASTTGDGAPRRRPAFTEHHAETAEEYSSFAIHDDGFKLVWNVDAGDAVPEHQLFEPAKDPLDQMDVAGANPDVVTRLAERLRNWRAWAEDAKLDTDAAEQAMSAEQLERLRSLGYVD